LFHSWTQDSHRHYRLCSTTMPYTTSCILLLLLNFQYVSLLHAWCMDVEVETIVGGSHAVIGAWRGFGGRRCACPSRGVTDYCFWLCNRYNYPASMLLLSLSWCPTLVSLLDTEFFTSRTIVVDVTAEAL
jgi:hypothetical protein